MKSERGRTRWAWERIQGIQHNEALDARNYALAALRILDPNMDAVESRLRSVRSGSSTESKKQPVRRRGVVKKNSISTDDW